jgi:hypothetical protein
MTTPAVVLLLPFLLVAPTAARAADWGGIDPGVTTTDQVRERYGEPTRQSQPKVEGYDTKEWVYEGSQAPTGLVRMTLDIGLLTPGGYKASVVRLLKLEPKPFIFRRATVIEGWGVPDGARSENGVDTFFYKVGLFVVFDKEGESATSLVFGPPQPDVPETATPAPAPKK